MLLSAVSALFLCACDMSDFDINDIMPGFSAAESAAKNSTGEDGNELSVTIVNDDNPVIVPEVIEPAPEPEAEYVEIYDEVNKEYSVNPADKDAVTLGFVGDIGFAEGYATIRVFRENGEDINAAMDSEVLSYLQGVDIMMANNEFPYSDRGEPTPDKTYTFRADPKDVHIMTDLGVDIVSLANNHAYDYGPDALIDTIDTLNGARLPFVGAGKNIEEAKKPAYFHAGEHVISYVSATQIERYGNPDTKEATEDSPGVLRTLDPDKFVEVIKEADANSDFVVVYVHWGSESTDLVEQSQRDLARAYVDAGADLIIGDHSHCLQGIDYVDDVPVFYSLGNFWFNSKSLDTCIVRTVIAPDGSISELKFIPCRQVGSKVRIATSEEKSSIIEYMRGISNYATIDDDGIVNKSDTDNNTQGGQNTSPAKKTQDADTAAAETETAAEPSAQDLIDAALNAAN